MAHDAPGPEPAVEKNTSHLHRIHLSFRGALLPTSLETVINSSSQPQCGRKSTSQLCFSPRRREKPGSTAGLLGTGERGGSWCQSRDVKADTPAMRLICATDFRSFWLCYDSEEGGGSQAGPEGRSVMGRGWQRAAAQGSGTRADSSQRQPSTASLQMLGLAQKPRPVISPCIVQAPKC